MCARFTLAVPNFASLVAALAEIARGAPQAGTVGATAEVAALYRPRYNIAPSDVHVVLRAREGQRELMAATWGFVSRWSRDAGGPGRLVNARSESARAKPTFREAFAMRRCVVPADGFFEWAGPKGQRRPMWFSPAQGGLLCLAGLYELARDPATGALGWTFTVLTTSANAEVAPVHDRMPAILAPSDVAAWLGAGEGARPDEVESLLRPAPQGTLTCRAVSPRVNSVAHDDPALICEVHEQPAGTLPLFDLDRNAALAAPPAGPARGASRGPSSGRNSRR